MFDKTCQLYPIQKTFVIVVDLKFVYYVKAIKAKVYKGSPITGSFRPPNFLQIFVHLCSSTTL